MAYINQPSATTTVSVAGGDTFYLAETESIIVASVAAAIRGSSLVGDTEVVIDGDAVSVGLNAIWFNANGAVEWYFHFGEEASIRSARGLAASSVYLIGDAPTAIESRLELNNDGEISGTRGIFAQDIGTAAVANGGIVRGAVTAGVHLQQVVDATVSNTGEISGRTRGVLLENADGTIFNFGDVLALDGVGIDLQDAVAEIHNEGLIAGTLFALRSTVQGTSLWNSGEMRGDVDLSDDGDAVFNSGLIAGDLDLNGGGNDLTNSGEIQGGVDAAGSVDDMRNSGVVWGDVDLGEGDNQLRNSGELGEGYYGGANADLVVNRGSIAEVIDAGAGDNTVRNLGFVGGEITTGNDVDLVVNRGVVAQSIETLGDTDVVRNHGSVGGSIFTAGAGDKVVNTGEIDGSIDTGDTADTVVNRGGSVGGDVSLGQGNDTYKARKGGEVDGRVQGNDNNDTLLGSTADETFEGGGGFDTLRGRGGDDELKGGAGDDLIAGGAGDDVMTGGINNDVFVIGRHSGDDQITDWTDGEDVLNLRALNIEISTSVGDVKAASQNRAGGVVIIDLDELGGDGSLEIAGWNVNLMSSDDFIF
ncbi:calcium-binding protein [Albimonas sp. CAU 1670]|uniref:calcium-binding protein n=1 Tax=Albimonas sp. CAU 1670 TaxID=3032599 RepID=UPI0023DCB206|nr:calcium-binding protein [Albimonas sp. CAU 1670]MDF2232718.1 calcium-binding protein [Albimonas sp. CAU 1670]